MNPVPVVPFTRAYNDSSTPGKLLSLDAALASLARRATGPLPGRGMLPEHWRQADALLDERMRVMQAEIALRAVKDIAAGEPVTADMVKRGD